tara:strand:+ start:7912 stop:9825 length:1914 start_codon:yes stop_codon:yes gene_type:complete
MKNLTLIGSGKSKTMKILCVLLLVLLFGLLFYMIHMNFFTTNIQEGLTSDAPRFKRGVRVGDKIEVQINQCMMRNPDERLNCTKKGNVKFLNQRTREVIDGRLVNTYMTEGYDNNRNKRASFFNGVRIGIPNGYTATLDHDNVNTRHQYGTGFKHHPSGRNWAYLGSRDSGGRINHNDRFHLRTSGGRNRQNYLLIERVASPGFQSKKVGNLLYPHSSQGWGQRKVFVYKIRNLDPAPKDPKDILIKELTKKINDFNQTIKIRDQQIEENKKVINSYNETIKVRDKQIEEYKKQIKDLEQQIKKIRGDVTTTQEEKAKLEGRLTQQIKNLNLKISGIEEENESEAERRKRLEAERKKRLAEEALRRAEQEKLDAEKNKAKLAERQSLLDEERRKRELQEELKERQRQEFVNARRKLNEQRDREAGMLQSFRERYLREQKMRNAAEESLVEARELVDETRNLEREKYQREKEKLEALARRREELRELRAQQEAAERRRKKKEEQEERERIDTLRRKRRQELAKLRMKQLRGMQMSIVETEKLHEEEERMKQVQASRNAIKSAGLQSEKNMYASTPLGVEAQYKEGDKILATVGMKDHYGVTQSNAYLKATENQNNDSGVEVEKNTIGGFIFPFLGLGK